MIKKFTFGIITLLLISCRIDHTDFSGDWIDKKNEQITIIIKKNGDNYIVENRGKKYPAQIKDGLLEISAELPMKATIDENDELIVAGQEYIRIEKSKVYKFIGNWKATTFMNDGIQAFPFKYKSGGDMEITIDFGPSISCNLSFKGKNYVCDEWFGGKFNKIYFDGNVLKARTKRYIYEFTLLSENKLKAKPNTDSDFVIFERK